jgi:predicted nucleic acid-binding protein
LSFTALLDANVLYPAYLNDALLRLAYAGLFQVRWSEQILDEMARNVKANGPELRHASIDRRVEKMKESFRDAMVTGHEGLIPSMTNHEKDRHILAAAVAARADLIVTSNVKHFPRSPCEPYKIDVQWSDDFLCYQWDLEDPKLLTKILERWAAQLSKPPLTLEQLLEEHLIRSAPKFSGTVLEFVRSQN